MAALLQQIGGLQVDQHALERQRQAHGGERRPHPFPSLAHRFVRQADQHQAGSARGDLHLNLDRHRLDAVEGEGVGNRHGGGLKTFGHGRIVAAMVNKVVSS